jgi:Trypsin-like peptidase domain
MPEFSAPRRRFTCVALAISCAVLDGCAPGRASMGFVNPQLTRAYIPLYQGVALIYGRWGAAVALTPDIAVTNDHNFNLVPKDSIVARSRDYDLLFFRSDSHAPPQLGVPWKGEPVIAYGQGGTRSDIREAKGTILSLNEIVAQRCPDCLPQSTITFNADAGEGFSGGPVVDASTGAVLGITFGYQDEPGGKLRRMYAYDIALVVDEMERLLHNGGE